MKKHFYIPTSFIAISRNRNVVLFTLLLSLVAPIWAQTTLISPSGDGGFETGADFASNGWSFDNGAVTNKWFVGTVPPGFTNRCAYISNNGGTSWAYTNTAVSVVHFWRDVTIPAGETNMVLTFNWQAVGETSSFDALMVSIAPTSYVPAGSGTSLGTGALAAPAITLAQLFNAGSVQTASIALPPAVVGNCSAIRLIFSWKCDNAAGNNPPAAIDNISLTSAAVAPLASAGPFTIDNTLPTSGTNFANFTAAINWLNSICVTNPVVFNVAAGETFNENPPVITASGIAAYPVTFQKSGAGANPVLTPPTGTAGVVDFGICISGGDYFTFDGIDINASAVSAVEYGYLIRNISSIDGAQNNTIKNCSITLNRALVASRAILQTTTTTGGGVTPTSASGANSNNKYYNLSIQNVYAGVYLLGTAAFPDLNCELGISGGGVTTIGGAAANDIGNGTSQSWGIRATSQSGVKIFNAEVRNVGSTTMTDGVLLELTQGISSVNNVVVHHIRSTSTTSTFGISGIRALHATTGTHTIRIYNNLIYGLSSAYTGAASAIRQLRGIYLPGASGSTAQDINVDFNSVWMDGSASPNISNTCFEIATVSGPLIRVRNNIFANFNGAQTGLAKHYDWVTPGATTGNSGSVSNRNVLYIQNTTNGFTGLASATDRTTLANWQSATSQDAASFSGDPQLISASNLHISTSVSTPVESGAAYFNGAITWVETDIDGEVRNSTTPDIGADEGNFVQLDNNAPSISYSPLPNVCSTGDITLSAVSISDQTGVPISGNLAPRIYYRKNADSWFSQPGTLSSGTALDGIWSFTIVVADLGGIAGGDVLSYYLIAQDVSTPTSFVGSAPAGVVAADVNTVTTPPVTPNTIHVNLLNGTYTVGAGGNFPTLTEAVNAYNTGCITGPVVFSLTDLNYTTAETLPISINANPGASALNTLTIKPVSSAFIAGTSSTCIIRLNGADYVNIDGSVAGSTSRNIIIQNYSTATGTAGVCLSSLGPNAGATHNTIQNCEIGCFSYQSASTNETFGIISHGTTISTSNDGEDNDYNSLINNFIKVARWGIYVRGASNNPNDNTLIANNIIGPAEFGLEQIGRGGLVLQHQNAAMVTQNEIRFVGVLSSQTAAGSDRVGIGLGDLNWPTPFATTITNTTVSGNLIHDVIDEKTFSSVGILVGGSGTPSSNTIANNMIYNVRANGTGGDHSTGIGIGAGNGDQIVFNSISLTGDMDPSGATTGTGSATGIRISSTTPTNLTLKNNIITVDVNSNTGTLKHYSIVAPAAYNWGSGGLNNNDYYINSANPQMALAGTGTVVPYTPVTTLAAWQSTFSPNQDGSSKSVTPVFTSATDLHLNVISNLPLNGAGTPIPGISTDYDGQTRHVTTPDIGVDEFTPLASDANLVAFVTPLIPFTTDAKSVKVILKNSGGETLQSATIEWQVNGASQTAYNWSGTLQSGDTVQVSIGSVTFIAGVTYNLKVWSSNPNGAADPVPSNDTIVASDIAKLAGVLFVDKNATGANNGNSWANAYTELGDALQAITSGEIWVAEGTYKPQFDEFGSSNPANPRDKTFFLKSNIALYGGFGGTEFSRAQRDWNAHPTILDGDLGGDDDLTIPLNQLLTHNTRDDNAYHLFLGKNVSGTIIDGFSVRNGNASKYQSGGNSPDVGGGIAVLNSAGVGSVTVRNCAFLRHSGSRGGVGFVFCYDEGESLTETFENCLFSGNSGGYDPYIIDDYTSGFHVIAFTGTSHAQFINCTISGNDAEREGFIRRWNGNVNITMRNTIMWNNVNGGIYEAGSSGATSVTYCDLQGGYAGTGNINMNPLFVDDNGADNHYGTADDNFSLQNASPCLNTGDPAGTYPDFDLAHKARAYGVVDMGAYESVPASVTCFADTDGDGYGNLNTQQTFVGGYCGTGFVMDSTDCNDNNAAIHPGATEIYFDGVDQDCNGMMNDNGLVAYFPFNGNASDASGTGNNGVVYNATPTTDRFGNPNAAYAFNGNGRIEVPDNITLRPASISAGAWVYYDNVPNTLQAIFGKPFNSGWQNAYTIYYNSGLPNALCTDGGSTNVVNIVAPAPAPPGGQWVHLVQVFDDTGNTMKLYINGVEVVSAPANFSLNFDSAPFLMGADIENGGLTYYFNGKIDELRIYNHALTATEVLAWYQEPAYAGLDKSICAGASTTLTASGGSSYLWSTGATTSVITVTPSSTTTYTVTATNALGVQSTDDVTITVVPTRLYVNQNATGANNGTSWADAYTDLGDALKVAQCGEIWVAEGAYHPKYNYTYDLPGNSRYKTFSLKKNVDVYGGFAGNETNLSDRNWNTHPTVLSGDLDNDDAIVPIDNMHNEPTRLNNAGHILTAYNTGGTTTVDGFFITGGNSAYLFPDFPSVHQGDGGAGLIVTADYGATTTVNVSNCRFYRNSSYWAGGAVANQAGLNSNGISTVSLTNCTFSGNRAANGGAVYSFSHHNGSNFCTIKNCAFTQNVGSSTVSNSRFSTFETCLMWLGNNILWGNTGGNAIAADAPTYYIHNDIQSGLNVGANFGNISADPLFTDPNGADDVIGTADDDLSLQAGSPCKDAGDPGATYPDYDLAHNDRTVGNVDMGAFELPSPCHVNITSSTGLLTLCEGDTTYQLSCDATTGILWSTGATTPAISVTAAGDYSVTVTNGSCTAEASVIVAVHPVPGAKVVGDTMVCVGNVTLLTASGGATYSWSTGETTASISVGTADTYTVTVTNIYGCTKTVTRNVSVSTVFPQPPHDLTPNGASLQYEDLFLEWSNDASATGYDVYLWKAGEPKPDDPIILNYGFSRVFYSIQDPEFETTYLWQVVAHNNFCKVASETASFQLRNLPDLIVEPSSILLPNTLIAGEDISISYTVRNLGPGYTGYNKTWTDNIYLSDDTIFNPTVDIFLGGVSNLSALFQGETYTRTATFHIPINDGYTGRFHIIVDAGWRYIPGKGSSKFPQTYVNNDTGVSTDSVTVVLPNESDLQVVAGSCPVQFFSNSKIQVNWTVQNRGIGKTNQPEWRDVVSLVKDTVTMAESFPLGFITHKGVLYQDSSYSDTIQSNKIPPEFDGKYYVVIATDSENRVWESVKESNNRMMIPVDVVRSATPDLVADHLTLPDTVYYGIPFQSSITIRNQGNVPADQYSSTQLFLKREPVLPDIIGMASSFELKNWLNAGDSIRLSTSITPVYSPIQPVLPGTYRPTVHVDNGDAIFEYNGENNNYSTYQKTLTLAPPDFVVTNLYPNNGKIPVVDTAGFPFQLMYRVKNQGHRCRIGRWNDEVYVTSTPNPEDPKIVEVNNTVEDAKLFEHNDQHTYSAILNLPCNFQPGTYYIWVKSNYKGNVQESDFSNNLSQPLAIQVAAGDCTYDLAVSDLKVTYNGLPTDSSHLKYCTQYGIRYKTTNTGTKPVYFGCGSDGTTVKFEDDVFLDSVTYVAGHTTVLDSIWLLQRNNCGDIYLMPGESMIVNGEFKKDPGKFGYGPAHDWSMRAFINTKFLSEETDPFNNVTRIPVHFDEFNAPDLEIEFKEDVLLNVTAGQPFTVKLKNSNTGPGPTIGSGQWLNIINFSPNPYNSNNYYDPGGACTKSLLCGGNCPCGVIWSDYQKGPWQGGHIDEKTITLSVPASTPTGVYYLLATTDVEDEICEKTENEDGTGEKYPNQSLAMQITVLRPDPADLVVESIEHPEAVEAGKSFKISWNVRNKGVNAASGYMREAVYLSKDQQWSEEDILMGYKDSNIQLGAGAMTAREIQATVTRAALESYYVIVRTDLLDNIWETNNNNNDASSGRQMAILIPHLPIGPVVNAVLHDAQPLFYLLDTKPEHEGETILVEITTPDSVHATNQLYLRRGILPTLYDFDYRSLRSGFGNQEAAIPSVENLPYFLLVDGFKGTGKDTQLVKIRASILPFQIRAVDANKGGNTGFATVLLKGAKFDRNMLLYLARDSVLIPADSLMFINATKAFARFNLTDQPLGEYVLHGQHPNGDTASWKYYTIEPGGSPKVATVLHHPPSVTRRGGGATPGGIRPLVMTLDFENQSNTDIPIPYQPVRSVAGAPLALSSNELLSSTTTELQVPLRELDGPQGYLRAGAKGSVLIWVNWAEKAMFFAVEAINND